MVIDDEQAHCRVDFPGKPRCAVTDQAYIIRSEYQGCVYELDVSLEFKKTQTPRVQELAQGLSLQWKEPDFEVKILQQKMLGVSYVVELCSVKQQPGSMVGRFYCSEEGVMYTLWVYGSGVPHYEIFDTFSLKSIVNRLD